MAFRGEWIFVALAALGLAGGLAVPAASQYMNSWPDDKDSLRDPAHRLRIARRIEFHFAEAETRRAAGECQTRRFQSLGSIQLIINRIEYLQTEDYEISDLRGGMAEDEGFPREARAEYRRRLAEVRLLPCTPPPPTQAQIQEIEQLLADARNARASRTCGAAFRARGQALRRIEVFEPTGTPRSPLLENWRSMLRAEEAFSCATPGVAPRSTNLCPSTFPAGTTEVICLCPPGPYSRTVFGSHHYSIDSGLCASALHAGVIGTQGGSIRAFIIADGRDHYVGSTRNGVTSLRAGASDRSFQLDGSSDSREERLGVVPLCRHKLNVYPDRERGSAITCRCLAGHPGYEGAVYGSGPYTSDSSICTAARHAGALTSDGDIVLVFATPGLDAYLGSTSNGVTSRDWGHFGESMNIQPGFN